MGQAVLMTEELPTAEGQPRPQPGRERGPVALLARLFLSQLLAVLAVATVITAVFAATGLDSTPGDAASSRQPTPTPGQTSPPPGADPSTSPPASPSAAASSTPAPSPTQTTDARPPKVDVLNQSAAGGTAASTAAGLRERDWRIGRVDDFSGSVRTTTIYYPDGRRRDARSLAKEFGERPRLLPRFGSLSENRLTVILVG